MSIDAHKGGLVNATLPVLMQKHPWLMCM